MYDTVVRQPILVVTYNGTVLAVYDVNWEYLGLRICSMSFILLGDIVVLPSILLKSEQRL